MKHLGRPSFSLTTVSLEDFDMGGAAALVTLGGYDLIIVGAELKAGVGPGLEVVIDGNYVVLISTVTVP